MAPLLHATLFKGINIPWRYELYETQVENEFLPALKQDGIVGCAVTMPYKVKLMSAADEVTEEGRMIGAINTIFRRKNGDKTLNIGTNTDCVGVREAFLQSYPESLGRAAGKPALVIGGGGACRAAVFALWKWLGASKIYMVNRLESEVTDIIDSFKAAGFGGQLVHVASLEQAADLETPVFVVGTVPDFPPKEPGEILARQITTHFLDRPEKGYILEMCYHPRPRTAFFELGEEADWKIIYSTESMIWQGVAQQILWAEVPLETFRLDEAKRVIADELAVTNPASLGFI